MSIFRRVSCSVLALSGALFLAACDNDESNKNEAVEAQAPTEAQQDTIDLLQKRGRLSREFMQGGLQEVTITARTYTQLAATEEDSLEWRDRHDFCISAGALAEGQTSIADNARYDDYYYGQIFPDIGPAGTEAECLSGDDSDDDKLLSALRGLLAAESGLEEGSTVVEQTYEISAPAYVDLPAAGNDDQFFVYFRGENDSGIVCSGVFKEVSALVHPDGDVNSRSYWKPDYNERLKAGDVPADYGDARLSVCAPVTSEDNNRHHQRFQYLTSNGLLP